MLTGNGVSQHIFYVYGVHIPRLLVMMKIVKRGRKMAFIVPDIKKTLEYRGRNAGTGKNGKEWLSLKCETLDEDNSLDYELTVPQDLQGDVYRLGLRKGDYIDVIFTARYGMGQGGSAYGYLQLQRCPMLVDIDDDGVVTE